MDNPEACGLDSLPLVFHGPLAAQHPQGELVDSRLEHGPKLPVHEAGLVQPVVLGYDLLGALQLDETRLVEGGRLAARGAQTPRCPLLGPGAALAGESLADARISFRDEAPLLRRVRAVRVAAGDGGDAAPEQAAVPIQVGLHAHVPVQVFAPGLLDAPAAAGWRRGGKMLEPDTFPLGALVAAAAAVSSIVSRRGSLPDALRQAVEPFAHGILESLHVGRREDGDEEREDARALRTAGGGRGMNHKPSTQGAAGGENTVAAHPQDRLDLI